MPCCRGSAADRSRGRPDGRPAGPSAPGDYLAISAHRRSDMQRLILEGPAKVRWEEAEAPALTDPAGAIVRPVAVATCDLDVAVLTGRYPLPGPYPFGHEAIGQVVETGSAVATVTPGDLVVVPFQI